MCDRFFAILVCDQFNPLESLKLALKNLEVETFCVPTLEAARRLIPQTDPHVVFTATSVADGSWVDVVNLANEARTPFNVIVVSANKDTKLYLSTLERGAFDFVLPPFEHQALDFVVQSAGQDARRRRQLLAHAAVA